MRVYVCYNNVAKELAALLAAWHLRWGKNPAGAFQALSLQYVFAICAYFQSKTVHAGRGEGSEW